MQQCPGVTTQRPLPAAGHAPSPARPDQGEPHVGQRARGWDVRPVPESITDGTLGQEACLLETRVAG